MTDNDKLRQDVARNCDRTNIDSVRKAIRALQGADGPELNELHAELVRTQDFLALKAQIGDNAEMPLSDEVQISKLAADIRNPRIGKIEACVHIDLAASEKFCASLKKLLPDDVDMVGPVPLPNATDGMHMVTLIKKRKL